MKSAQRGAEVLADPVTLQVQEIDRMYLNLEELVDREIPPEDEIPAPSRRQWTAARSLLENFGPITGVQ